MIEDLLNIHSRRSQVLLIRSFPGLSATTSDLDLCPIHRTMMYETMKNEGIPITIRWKANQ